MVRAVKICLVTALLAAASFAPALAGAQVAKPRPQKLVVFDFVAQGEAPKVLGRTLSEEAARTAAAIAGLSVLTQADVAAQLGADVQRPTGSCADDRACMAEIAGALDADRTLAGSITQIGDNFVLAVSLVDARKMSTLGGAQETMKGAKLEQLMDAARRLTHKVITGKLLETTGSIDFDVNDDGAQVLLDGVEIGKGPFRETRRVPEGPHRVIISLEGYAPWETAVRVAAGATTTVAPTLAKLSWQQAAKPARPPKPVPKWRLYAEGSIISPKPLALPSNVPVLCNGSRPSEGCGGTEYGLRAGWRIDKEFSAEGSVHRRYYRQEWVDGPSLLGAIEITQWSIGGGMAWNPLENRFFSVAAHAGYSFGDVGPWVYAPTGAGSTGTPTTIQGPFARVEARADYGWEWVQAGLRAGLTSTALFGSATFPAVGGGFAPIEWKNGLATTLDFGVALRFYFH